jgi:hypothetical protein
MRATGHEPERATTERHAQLPIVRITIDDAVLVLGVLELVSGEVDPGSDLGILVDRSARRISARLAALTDALSPTVRTSSGGRCG